jgi:2,4-dienoyl-CoA reductase-like NADH-dependent reductase (Old Yellow Enzyme family)
MKLLEPLDVGPVTLPNRLAVPAMVTRLSGEDGKVNEDVIDRYARYAEGNVGLIVVEASSVHGGKSGPLLRVSDDEFIPGLRALTSACHAASDSKVFLQIIHFLKIARSGWREKVSEVSAERLEELPQIFAAAALRAQEAGFDGVELHMAHAYTLSSMLSRHNRRADQYGRTLENRLRLPSMVLKTVRETVDPSFGVAVRFDADESIRRGYSVIEAGEMAIRFAELGAGYVSLSAGGKFEDAVHREGKPLYPYTGYSGDRCMPGDTYVDGANAWMADAVRSALRAHGHDTPVLATGKITCCNAALATSSAWPERCSPTPSCSRSSARVEKTRPCDASTATCASRSTRTSTRWCATSGRRARSRLRARSSTALRCRRVGPAMSTSRWSRVPKPGRSV